MRPPSRAGDWIFVEAGDARAADLGDIVAAQRGRGIDDASPGSLRTEPGWLTHGE